ncbi:MAG: nucleotide sugar dehydrogenase [Pseudomonadota bacterium]
MFSSSSTIGIIGLGYVGMPLAAALAGKGLAVTGYDIDARRVERLQGGIDDTAELSVDELQHETLTLTTDADELRGLDFIIVTVPTPISHANRPDLEPLLSACRTIAPRLHTGQVVVFESTVYPSATEADCVPLLEAGSGLKAYDDFRIGYSPERINPGDATGNLQNVVKVVAAQDDETLDAVQALYDMVVEAGTHRAASIAVAEAAKVLENTQRDVNIALMNEMALLCDKLGIRSHDVIETAATKWNFNRYTPGLVGGHCIGVDPYYLTSKAEEVGYKPELILAGRAINDSIPYHLTQKIVKLLAKADQPVRQARVGILGLSFKENVPDFRNSKAIAIMDELNEFAIEPLAHDPFMESLMARPPEAAFSPVGLSEMRDLNCCVWAVTHSDYKHLDGDAISAMIVHGGVFIDVKSQIDPVSLRADITYWSL